MNTVQTCKCCVDSKPLYKSEDSDSYVCLFSGHVHELRNNEFNDTGLDSSDYERRQTYLEMKFPDDARPNILPREKINLSQYAYA